MTTKNLSVACLLVCLGATACPDQHPAAPEAVKGQEVNWGENFAAADQQPKAAAEAMHAEGGAMAPTMTWEGGEASRGRVLFADKCARCHGKGDPSTLADGNPVPSLRPAALESKTERDLARHIAHGHGAMPAFVGELNREQLLDLISALRNDVGGTGPAPVVMPEPATAPASAPAAAP
ncbi:MAG: cytochrome c [Pseudomonadota bacterium]